MKHRVSKEEEDEDKEFLKHMSTKRTVVSKKSGWQAYLDDSKQAMELEQSSPLYDQQQALYDSELASNKIVPSSLRSTGQPLYNQQSALYKEVLGGDTVQVL